MNEDKIKGKIEEIKGDVKQRIGGASKDPKTQAEGFAQEKKGQLRKGIGELEEDLDEQKRRERERREDEPER